MSKIGISIKGLLKIYNGKTVLEVGECDFAMGSIYGIIGTNGVGKTTLLKIINGIVEADHGRVDTYGNRIEMVDHNSGLFQEMTVYENMFLHREIYHRKLGVKTIDWKQIRKKTKEILEKFQLDLPLESPVRDLPASSQKLLEVVIALSKSPDIIMIDEPMTLLDHEQIRYLNGLIDHFVSENKMAVYSSHRLDELFKVVDKVVTMREGKIVAIQEAEDHVLDGLLEFAERDVHKYPKRPVAIGGPILEIDGLTTKAINQISFDLHKGEILGIIGLKGAYKSNIGKALFGAIPAEGRFRVNGSIKKIRSTTQAVEAGICYIGSANEGMFVEDSLIDNVVSANVPRARKLSRSAKRLVSKYYLDMLNIDDDKADASLKTMSAGNKQKVLLAKWFFSKSMIFIFNKPTANIDVPSKVDIYNIFADLVASGAGIMVISNDLEEVAGICDRVLVIKSGEIAYELNRPDLSVHSMVEHLQNWS